MPDDHHGEQNQPRPTIWALLSELNRASTYLDIAQSVENSETKADHIMKARETYSNVEGLVPEANLTEVEAGQLRTAMQRLLVRGLVSSGESL
jgi:hypothetical protein